ncbi:hypothetical protein [Ensifer sp.]|uniref:hypothetical protein n=1 Tax=Ensifer sp. TaxID=1872086 RepID=UPI0028981DBC|nr:hypothetical protein [Ensifer sp.]
MTSNSLPDAGTGSSAGQMREELSRILESPGFKSTPRRRRLLTFLVEEFLAGRSKGLKGYTIATVVFGRDESFDPQTDPIVRLEVRRLRHDLDGYYVSAGRDSPRRIAVPKGQYMPVMEWKQDTVVAQSAEFSATATPEPPRILEPANPRPNGRLWLTAAALFILAGGLSLAVVLWYLDDAKGHAHVRGPALAVLPFATDRMTPLEKKIGGDIAEGVLTRLSQISGLRLYDPGTEAQAMEGPIEVGVRLGLTHVLDGSVRTPDATKLRVIARLLEVSTRRIVWIGEYERSDTVGFTLAVQDEIARSIAATIGETHGTLPGDR